MVETLISENEPSLRLLAEWIIVRLVFEDRTTRLNDLFDCLRNAHRNRVGTICAWISISAHLLHFLSEPSEQVSMNMSIISYSIRFRLDRLHQSSDRTFKSIICSFQFSYSNFFLFDDDQIIRIYRTKSSWKTNTVSNLSMVQRERWKIRVSWKTNKNSRNEFNQFLVQIGSLHIEASQFISLSIRSYTRLFIGNNFLSFTKIIIDHWGWISSTRMVYWIESTISFESFYSCSQSLDNITIMSTRHLATHRWNEKFFFIDLF